MAGRFFKGFQKRVERRLREHVRFVNDVDLVPSLHGEVPYRLPQLPYLVDAPVGGCIDLDDVHEPAPVYSLTGLTRVAGFLSHAIDTINRLCEYP